MGQYTIDYDEDISSEKSDWGLCWQVGIKGGLVFILGKNVELGLNGGYVYYKQNYVKKISNSAIEEVSEFKTTASGPTFGLTLGIAAF